VLFVITAWCFFQVDFGSFFPTIGILLLAALWNSWPRIKQVFVVGLSLGIAIAPWVWYYELGNRLKSSADKLSHKFLMNLFHFNQFLIPLLLLLLGAVFIWVHRRKMEPAIRLILFVSFGLLFAVLIWVPVVSPLAFHRYLVHLAPVAALCAAWTLNQLAARIIRHHAGETGQRILAGLLILFVAVSPLVSNPVTAGLRQLVSGLPPTGRLIRSEWAVLCEEVFAPQPDPNRLTIEALKRVASPQDEILINYEDIPLMFYTDYRIRGGIPAFRVEDASSAPRFLIYRQSVNFVYTDVFKREIERYNWRQIPSDIPDIPWGDIPEPDIRLSINAASAPRAIFAENIGPMTSKQEGEGKNDGSVTKNLHEGD
ncbi:MAG: hypothetical protein JXB18_06895, partial [Sedimentisphaerales bacterium]|nr:hypothetical protein [Sedimentisphaerales bacterium]